MFFLSLENKLIKSLIMNNLINFKKKKEKRKR